MGVFEQLNSGQSPPTTGGGVFGRLKSDFQQRQLNQELNDKQQMDQASAISDSMPPSTPTWNGLLDNPITHGVETGLSWAAKPFETVSTGLADTVGAVNNLFGSEKRTGFDGKEYVSTPSESRNFLDDVKSIWSQTNSDTSSKAWQGVFPNLGKMKGTDTNWTDVLDFGAQAAIPLDVAPLLKAAKLGSEGLLGARLAGEAGNAIAKEPLALNTANNAASGIFARATERPSLGAAVDDFTGRLQPDISSTPIGYTMPGAMTYPSLTDSVRARAPQIVPKNDFSLNTPAPMEPTNLDELVRSKGFGEVNPETIAQTYNDKTWYHGTGNDKLTAETLDPFVGSHESLFGQGVYLTDNPKIAEGYANSRGKRTTTPTIYEGNVNMNRVLDLEKPVTPDVYAAIDKSVKPLDYQYNYHFEESNHFTDLIRSEAEKGSTPEQIITKLRTEVGNFSHEADIPTSEFVDNFQDLAINLKKAGYDAITHAGGSRTGNESHRVMIVLDPQNWHGATGGSQVTRFEKYNKPAEKATTGYKVDNQPVFTKSEQVNTDTMKGNWFTNLFGEQNIGITPFGSNKSNKMVSTEQQIVNNPLKQSVSGLLDSTKQLGRSTYQNTVDYLSPLKNITKETYNTAMDSSRANNLANTIIRDKFVDNQGNVIGSSLNDIMKSVSGLGKKFDDYLVLRHAETRMNRGERVYDDSLNMTPQKAREAAATLERRYPQLKQAGEEWNKFNTNMLDSGVKEGLISQVARDTMRAENPNYASMRRQFTIGEKLSQPKWGSGGSSFSGQSAPIKEVSPTGSTRKIVSPVRSAVEQAYAWKNAELRNRTMQEITKAIQSDPEGMRGIAEIVKKPSTSYHSLDDALRQGGSEEFLQQLDNDFKSLFKPAKTGDENIVRAMINGNPVYIKVHSAEAVKALLGMGSDQSGIILQAMQKLSNATKRGATGLLAPMFAVKNLTADTVQAAIQSPNAFKHVAVDLPHAVISSIADIFKIPGLNHLAEDFRRSGGEYSALLRGDRGLNKSVFDLRKVAPLSPEGVVKGSIAAVKAPFKALEKVADVTENVNRMAAFRRAMMGKERTPENVRNAINAARESTTNFSRKGAVSREVEAFVPYSNAAVQGIYRTGNAFYKNPVKTIAGVGTLVIAPKLYEYAKFNNDPDYQKLPARERYRNLIIRKNDDGTFTKVPMPPEYSALGAFVTDVLNDVVNHDPQAYKGTLDALANAFTPPFVSGALQGATQGGGPEKSIAGALNATVAAPFVATVANQSFTGAPIVSKAVADRSPEYQYDEKTSNIAKTIGQVAGMSPMKVDYLIRAYGGDPARLLLPLNSPVGAGNTRNTLLKNFIVDPQLTNTLTNDFYTSKQKLDQAYKDNKEAGAPLPSWYSEDLRKQMDSQGRGSTNKQLSDLTAQKKTINADANLPAEQKSAKLRAIQGQMNDIYMDINSKLYKQGVPIK